MLPQTAATLAAFLLLVVPGLVFELLRQTRRPAFEQSSLEEIGRIVVASVVLDTAAGALLLLLAVKVRGPLLQIGEFARPPEHHTYWRDHPVVVLLSLALEVGLATLFGVLVHRSLNREDGDGLAARVRRFLERVVRHRAGESIERPAMWWTMFRRVRPAGAMTEVVIKKKSGEQVKGVLAAYSPSPAGADIAIRQPIVRLEGNAVDAVPDRWPLVIVRGDEISEVAVRWPPDDGNDLAGRPRRHLPSHKTVTSGPITKLTTRQWMAQQLRKFAGQLDPGSSDISR